jgi:E3 ubiquitin-protein ligase RFWD3
VKKKDLRRIYCRALHVLDTSERDNAIRERDLEKKARKKLAYEKAELQLAYDIIKDQLKRLQNDHERLLKITQGLINPAETLDDSSRSSTETTTTTTNLPPPPAINMRLETVIKITEGMCRVLAYAPSHQWLFVSQPTNNSLYPGYGIKKISLIDGGRAPEYTTLRHTKPIRDIQLHGDLLLSCAWDKTMRIFDYTRNTFNLLCECASQVWSCAWNLDDPNIIYAGLNNGRVQVFDRRQTPTGETTLTSSSETLSLSITSPIVSLQYIQKNNHFQSSGLIVGSNEKSGFYEHIPNSEYRYHALPIDKNLSSLHYDSTTNRLLASFRPQSSPARHELYELITRPIEDSEQTFIVSLQLIQTFLGSSINIVLSRSKIIHKNFETYIVASDNGSHGIELWNIRQSPNTPSFKIPTQCDIVDVCLTRQHLCALADNQVRLYKWT